MSDVVAGSEEHMGVLLSKIDALSQVLIDEIYHNMNGDILGVDNSFIVAKSIARLQAVFARLFFELDPGLFEQFLLMGEKEILVALNVDMNK